MSAANEPAVQASLARMRAHLPKAARTAPAPPGAAAPDGSDSQSHRLPTHPPRETGVSPGPVGEQPVGLSGPAAGLVARYERGGMQ